MNKDNLVHANAATDKAQSGQLNSVPTAFEVALKAYADEYALWAYGHYDAPDNRGFRVHAVWRGDDQIAQNSREAPMQALMIRMRADASMRAALLALADADISKEVINAGFSEIDGDMFEDHFRTVLGFIAQE
jgi:hypothetical protein